MILALNYSYCVFKDRKTLVRYLQRCRKALSPDGIMVMDTYGGPSARRAEQDRHKEKGFTYIWDQASFNPITNETVAKIHFAFPDGSRMRNAFTYNWRLWTVPELRDALIDAGFRENYTYLEDLDGNGQGTLRERKRVAPENDWNAYIIGR